MSLARLPCLLLILSGTLCAGTFRAPQGDVRATGAADLLLTRRSPSWYNEIWTWQFVFDDGTQGTLNFTWAKLGIKSPVCGADLSLAGFKGRSWTVGREYPAERFSQQGNPFRVQIHPDIWFQGLPPHAHRLHFATNKAEGYYLDLTFSQMVPGAAWGNGTFVLDGGELSVAVPIPSARVSGRIAVGDDTVAVRGWASLEHVRQTALVGSLMEKSLRQFQPGAKPSYLNAFQDRSGTWRGFALDWSSGAPEVVPFETAQVSGADARRPPDRAAFVGRGKNVSFTRSSIAQSNSVLDGMEGVTRWVVKQFMGDVRISRGRSGAGGYYQYVGIAK